MHDELLQLDDILRSMLLLVYSRCESRRLDVTKKLNRLLPPVFAASKQHSHRTYGTSGGFSFGPHSVRDDCISQAAILTVTEVNGGTEPTRCEKRRHSLDECRQISVGQSVTFRYQLTARKTRRIQPYARAVARRTITGDQWLDCPSEMVKLPGRSLCLSQSIRQCGEPLAWGSLRVPSTRPPA